jgi:cell division protein FtsZ
MTVVRESFGRDPHIAMGAVIDESWHQKVEICVIGTTDVNGRSSRRTTGRTGRKGESTRRAEIAEKARSDAQAMKRAAIESGADEPVAPIVNRVNGKVPVRQEEFSFAESESRGRFDHTDGTFFEGEDLDIPTYRRRGIRVAF